MKNLKLKSKLFALALGSSLVLTSCSLTDRDTNSLSLSELQDEEEIEAYETYHEEIHENQVSNTEQVDEKRKVEEIEKSEPTEEEKFMSLINDVESVSYVVATGTVNIREKDSTESEKIGVLAEGAKLKYVDETDKFYEVEFNDGVGFISKDYSTTVNVSEINKVPDKIVYCTSDTTLYDEHYEGEIILPTYELCKVYGEYENMYFVDADGYVGYIDSTTTKELTDTFVVVDISDQDLEIYQNNEVTLETSVVTGKPSTPTDIGCYEVFEKTYSRYLVGPTWKSYVDVMMKFNGGQGLHDAEYHTCTKSHGWRDISEFGGSTYLTNGSHGCVNMPHDAAMEASEIVEEGTKVLVKK